jgi:hypothetical protein
MAAPMKRAKQAAEKKNRGREGERTDSDDSDAIREDIDRRIRIKELKKATKQQKEEEASLQRRYDEQCAANARKMKELAEKRNEYPVFLFMNLDSFVVHYN